MAIRLTDQQIRQRLQEGRNYKRLYRELKVKYDAVLAENKRLRAENAELKRYFTQIIDAQAARIEQLEAMVFGRRSGGGGTLAVTPAHFPAAPRPASSYRRPVPPDTAITNETRHPLTYCGTCGGTLVGVTSHVRYIEDIVLPALAPTASKTVEKQIIERGWCQRCGHFSSALDLRGQTVQLGPQVRLLVAYLNTIQGLTYSQIQHLLQDIYDLPVTDGEIAAILAAERQQLLPRYHDLQDAIRAGPVHLDETRCRIQSEAGAGYAWVMASALNDDVIFCLSDGRGKGTARALTGEQYDAVGVTDRYGAYKHLFVAGKHQICWAHLERNARDLTNLQSLAPMARRTARDFHLGLHQLYRQVRQYHAQVQVTGGVAPSVILRLRRRVERLCRPGADDPRGLARLKAGIMECVDCLFVCLTGPGVPPDNNKAERHLRKLVLKRTRSFGVKTLKGARTLETLLSVCWSLWYRDRQHFFQNLQQALQA